MKTLGDSCITHVFGNRWLDPKRASEAHTSPPVLVITMIELE
jgi:hypothetical protein